MPHKVKESDADWPFKISIDLSKSAKSKIAFGSGDERKYFEFKGNANDTPKPSYYPPALGVHKPISKKGFGIGNLSADRWPFRREQKYITPGPPDYKPQIAYSLLTSKFFDFADPRIAQQCIIAFNGHKSVNRFGLENAFKPLGPGSYHWEKTLCKSVKRQESFGSRRIVCPTTKVICTIYQGESCNGCGKSQNFDYYRTRMKIISPYSPLPEEGEPTKIKCLVLCRKCYCKAKKNPYWPKKTLETFEKARNCSFIHDHRGMVGASINKTTCRNVEKLKRKEVVLNKHFPDYCERVYKNEVVDDDKEIMTMLLAMLN